MILNKLIPTLLLCFLFTNTICAQKIKIKNDIVTLDGNEILSCKTTDFGTEFSIYKLNTKDEIIFSKDIKGYNTILFNELDLKMKSEMFFNNIKEFIKWLYNNEIFNSEGKINEEKVKLFIKKYNIETENK